MTETCSPGTGHPQEGPEKPGSIGLMLPGIEMDVVALDDPKKVLPPGEVGEIRIKGPNVTQGYWNRPKETAECFRRRPFLTANHRLHVKPRVLISIWRSQKHDHRRGVFMLVPDDRPARKRSPTKASAVFLRRFQ